ncbi:MAG: aldo/keto reductase [Planctomycetota bacterium]
MRYVEFGKTGKRLSVVGFGGMRFDVGKNSKAKNAKLLLHAASLGVNYFDTAPGYCSDQSEDIFGIAWKDMPEGCFLGTKGSPTDIDTARGAREAVEKSLTRLGVEKIHFYYIWCLRKMEHYTLAMRPGGLYEGALRCKEEGLIDHILCSTHQPGHEIRAILSKNEFEGCLMGLNLLNFPYRWDGVLAAQERGMGVLAMNPLAGGVIPQHEKELAFLASPGETPTEAALRFNIACREIDVTLSGFSAKEEIDMACRIADEAKPMDPAGLDRIRSHLGKNMDEICTGCGYCWDCPQEIPIPSYMQYYNSKVMFSTTDEEMKQGLAFQHAWGLLVGRKAEAGDCVECGRCEEACTQHLPIIKRLKEIAAWEKSRRTPKGRAG